MCGGYLEQQKAITGLWGRWEPAGIKSNLVDKFKRMFIGSGSSKMKQMTFCLKGREKQTVVFVMLLELVI